VLVRYIHLNPLRAGIVADLDRLEIYVYGGHGRLTGCLTDEWQSVDGVFSFWGKQQRTFRRHCGWVWMGQPWQYEWG
jgi:hypothetical protein